MANDEKSWKISHGYAMSSAMSEFITFYMYLLRNHKIEHLFNFRLGWHRFPFVLHFITAINNIINDATNGNLFKCINQEKFSKSNEL